MNKKVTIDVLGMTCAACSSRVEKAIGKQEGVIASSVKFTFTKATIEFDMDK